MTSLVIGAIGAGLIVVGVLAYWRQSKAASCPRHSRVAGRVAMLLALVCMIAGIGLVGFSANQNQTMNKLFSTLKRWVGLEQQQPFNPPALPQAEAEQFVDLLIDMGYLKFVAEPQKAEVRRQLIESATHRYLDAEWDDDCVAADLRGYPADNENLAEGDVGVTIRLMQPVLEQEGVKLDDIVDDFGDEKYEVVINGKPQLIYEGEGGDDSWTTSLQRLLEITNKLLEDAGSNERLYAIYGGNDGRVILLTEEMHDYIESMGDVLDQGWMPQRAKEVGER